MEGNTSTLYVGGRETPQSSRFFSSTFWGTDLDPTPLLTLVHLLPKKYFSLLLILDILCRGKCGTRQGLTWGLTHLHEQADLGPTYYCVGKESSNLFASIVTVKTGITITTPNTKIYTKVFLILMMQHKMEENKN